VAGGRRLSCRPTQAGKPGDGYGRKDGEGEMATRAETCRCGWLVSKEIRRTTTIVKTLFVEITTTLMHVIDYQDTERKFMEQCELN